MLNLDFNVLVDHSWDRILLQEGVIDWIQALETIIRKIQRISDSGGDHCRLMLLERRWNFQMLYLKRVINYLCGQQYTHIYRLVVESTVYLVLAHVEFGLIERCVGHNVALIAL